MDLLEDMFVVVLDLEPLGLVVQRHRKVLVLCVVEDSLVAKKAVEGTVVGLRLLCQQMNFISKKLLLTLLRGMISARVLLRWGSLGWIAATITWTAVLVGRLCLCHRGIKKTLIVSARLDEPLIELCEIVCVH